MDNLPAPGPLTFLVASPHLRGGFFGDAVILLLEHTQEGAMGLIINQELDTPISELLPDAADAQGYAMLGGPVEPQVGWCLHEQPIAHAAEEGELTLLPPQGGEPGLVATTHLETFAEVRRSGQRYRLLLGYAGWEAGQLENETREGAWLWLEDSSASLFWDLPAAERWQAALDRLGVDPSTVAAGGAEA